MVALQAQNALNQRSDILTQPISVKHYACHGSDWPVPSICGTIVPIWIGSNPEDSGQSNISN